MNSKHSPGATLDCEYVSSELRRCTLLQHIAEEYYDVSVWPESDETIAANPDRIPREYRYLRLHREASVLNDEIQRHIYQYAAQECRKLCESIHAALPQELRDIIYDFIFDAMRPPPPERPTRYFPPQTYEELSPPRSDRENAHIGDVEFVGKRMLYELAQTWSRRSTIIVARGWRGVIPVEDNYWNDTTTHKERPHCVVVQTAYPIAKHGQDFSNLARDVAVLGQFERPLNILIDWDTHAVVQDKVRFAETNMIEYFENFVELYPLLESLLDSGNRVSMTFTHTRQPFPVKKADLEDSVLLSKDHKARCGTCNRYRFPPGSWYSDIWTCGSDVSLPRVLHGLL